jgi:mevalonate pyrophosphate decarboxylase
VSLTVAPFTTRTTVEWGAERDEVVLDGSPRTDGARRRVLQFLDLVDPHRPPCTCARTTTSPPPPARSSSSAFAALALAATKAAASPSIHGVVRARATRLGSACRSIWGGLVHWPLGERVDGLDSHGRPLRSDWDLAMVRRLVADDEKETSSRDGMTRTQETSPLYEAWVANARTTVRPRSERIEARDLEALGTVMERPRSRCTRRWRARIRRCATEAAILRGHPPDRSAPCRGLGAWVTMDAGPNVKVLCDPTDAPGIVDAIADLGIAHARPGSRRARTMDRAVTRTVVAPGKIVLVGEYAVLDGGPAIVMAVDRGVRCDVLEGSGIETPDGDARFVAPAIGDAATRERFVFSDWNPPDVGGEKPGLGGSPRPASPRASPSIVRPRMPTRSTHRAGRRVGRRRGRERVRRHPLFERRKVVALSPLQPVVVYSGAAAATGPADRALPGVERSACLRARVRARRLRFPRRSARRNGARRRAPRSDGGERGHRLLDAAPPRDRRLGARLWRRAKPSGAGGGDCAVALFSSSADRAAFRERLRRRGIPRDRRPTGRGRAARSRTRVRKPRMSGSDIGSRKSEHLDLCIEDDVAFQDKTNLFEEVHLVHDALPELALDDIDLRTELVGKTLKAPLVIAAMTGGVERANAINRDLRASPRSWASASPSEPASPPLPRIEDGYRVRDVAPTALVLGNIGLVQSAGHVDRGAGPARRSRWAPMRSVST